MEARVLISDMRAVISVFTEFVWDPSPVLAQYWIYKVKHHITLLVIICCTSIIHIIGCSKIQQKQQIIAETVKVKLMIIISTFAGLIK